MGKILILRSSRYSNTGSGTTNPGTDTDSYVWDDIPALTRYTNLSSNTAQVNSVSVQIRYGGSSRHYQWVRGVRYKGGYVTAGTQIGIYRCTTDGVTQQITNHTVTSGEAGTEYIEILFDAVQLADNEYVGVQTDGVLWWEEGSPAIAEAMSISTLSTDHVTNNCIFGYSLYHK